MLQQIAKKFIRHGNTLVYQRIFNELRVKHYCKVWSIYINMHYNRHFHQPIKLFTLLFLFSQVIDIDDDGKFTVTLTINGEEKQMKNVTEITPFECWIINEDDCIRDSPLGKNPYESFSIIDSSGKYQTFFLLVKS